uniref:Uncharacterized protein n=1 Tax=Glossina brevipalpis TaxID=37001 RepID=A0A1A9W2K8_9MUSC
MASESELGNVGSPYLKKSRGSSPLFLSTKLGQDESSIRIYLHFGYERLTKTNITTCFRVHSSENFGVILDHNNNLYHNHLSEDRKSTTIMDRVVGIDVVGVVTLFWVTFLGGNSGQTFSTVVAKRVADVVVFNRPSLLSSVVSMK